MFKRIEASSTSGQSLVNQLVDSESRTNYNLMAREYNATPKGDFLVFPWNRDKAATIHTQLGARGLLRDKDYTLGFYLDGEESNACVTRVSETEAEILQPTKRGPRVKPVVDAPQGTPTPPASEVVGEAPVEGKRGRKSA